MTPEGRIKKRFIKAAKLCGVFPFVDLLERPDARGIVINLELARVRGIPDKLILYPGGRVEFIEFKRLDNGELSPTQKLVIAAFIALRVPVSVISSEDDIEAWTRKHVR